MQEQQRILHLHLQNRLFWRWIQVPRYFNLYFNCCLPKPSCATEEGVHMWRTLCWILGSVTADKINHHHDHLLIRVHVTALVAPQNFEQTETPAVSYPKPLMEWKDNDNDQSLITSTDGSQFTWLWWWLPLRMSKRQSMSPQTVLLRSALTRTIILHRLIIWLLGSNHFQEKESYKPTLLLKYTATFYDWWFDSENERSDHTLDDKYSRKFYLLIQLIRTTLDIDECMKNTHNCSKDNGMCNNTECSFNCTCLTGYTGDGHNCTCKCCWRKYLLT